ncbi:restriction endonuclease S subunit [Mycobacteroides abscessus subsp. abscessus]|nr:restriction endonuclease S subunit [Mycobacteroides abscessus subsp. abscessus]
MALHRETRIGLAQLPVSFNQDVKALVPKAGILPEFLLYALQARSGQIRELVSSAGSGTGVLNTQLLQRLPIWVPSEETQQLIVEAMSDTDDLIATLERLITKKQAIKQGMMQQLLTGRTRLPGFDDEWCQSTVGREFDIQLGKRLDAAVNRGEFKTCINNRAVRWGRIMLGEAIEAPLTDADIQTLRLVPGDVLMCEGGEIGRSAVWRGELTEAYFLNTLHRLRSNGEFDPYLLVAYFQRRIETGELSAVIGKATLAHLTKENLVQIPIPMPSRDEQVQLAAVLKDADNELDMLGSRLAKARAIKTGMMQQLLTGRTRLPVEASS